MSENNNKGAGEFNFDLPAVEGAAVVKPRVHYAGESVCISCEG